MATYQQTIADNLMYLQRQIDRINTAQMGPVTIAAGDGSMKMLGTNGSEVFSFNEEGMFFLHRGSRRNMSVFSDNVVSWLERHDTTLSEHNSRISTAQSEAERAHSRLEVVGDVLDSHNTRIANAGAMAGAAQRTADNAQSRLDTVGNVLDSHNTRIANAGAMAGAAQRSADAAQSRADSAYSRASTGISNAATAQARADSAYSRAGTGISNAATAKSRADAAYSLAQGRATQSQINSLKSNFSKLASEIDSLAMRVLKIENQIRP